MKTKLLFSIFCLLVAIHVVNADTPTFTFTSSWSSVSFTLESSNSTCLIDWGDGVLVTQSTSAEITNSTAYSIGGTVKVYDSGIKKILITNQFLTSLDVTNASNLDDLNCSSNQLTALDLSQNASLRSLSCSSNQLTSLDLSHNTALTSIDCESNQLTSLDLSHNTVLTNLDCSYNQLTSIDLSQNTALTSLNCIYNQLTSLDITHTVLTSLDCYNNQLTSLYMNNNTALTNLMCYNNQLTSLDATHTALTFLDCSYNQLTSLYTPSTTLTYLDCSINLLNYATLPQPKDYSCHYSPQQQMQATASGNVVDLSSQLTAKDKNDASYTTVYSWYKQDGTLLVSGTDYTESNGIFTFSPSITGNIYCEMTNGAFPYMSGSDVLRTVDIALGGTSGVNSQSNQSIAVYPNPAVTSFSVEGLQKEGVIKIYDVTGKKVIEKTIAPKEEISVSEWNKGVYIVKLNGMTSKLIVK